MSIDRELLWKAWPEGYIAQTGVTTIGGWLSVVADDSIWPVAIFVGHGRIESVEVGPPDRDDDDHLQGSGDLLPLLDPKDAATWACALRDLAEVVGEGLDPIGGGLVFTRQGEQGRKKGDWLLCDWNSSEVVVLERTTITDPALALAWALANWRESA